MKIDSVKSNSVEKYRCLEMGKGVVEISEWYSREQSNNPRIPLEEDYLRMGNSSTITKEKPPIKTSRNVRFQTVNSNVTCSTTDHCSMVEANIIGKNQRLLKDSQIPDSKKENNSGFFQEASANKLTGHNMVAKADTADPTIYNNATAETNDESELLTQDSDWLLQYNPRDGRPLYINLRTGNTSATIPDTKPAPRVSKLEGRTTSTKRTVDSTKMRRFRDHASHLSHNFTPWLPRSAITSGENCDVSKGGAKQSSEIRSMFDQWVNPVFERNERVRNTRGFVDMFPMNRNVNSRSKVL
jgi:predicted nuclease of predicted toxin-antitoxin system